jgi:SAM-dependent methyltransferase
MKNKIDFNSQFSLDYGYFLNKLDLVDWLRYFFIIRTILDLKLKEILEIGAGNEVVKNCLQKFVNVYKVMDINEKLKPDVLAYLREFKPELKEKFDCVVCAEVLEHMPFEDLEKNLTNIYNYLRNSGKAIITIPHRRARILIITPLSYFKPLIITLPFWIKSSLKSFYQQVIKKKVWIDPHHCWEIGDGKINLKDVEEVMKRVGFKIDKFFKLLYSDFRVLSKN